MWNKLRARHFTIIILGVIVMLETSAIAIDRFLTRNDNTAFQVVGQFKNNAFVSKFQAAEAKSRPIPSSLNRFSANPLARNVSSGRRAGVNAVSGGIARPSSTVLPTEKSFRTVKIPAQTTAAQASSETNQENRPELTQWVNYQVKKGDSLASVAGLFNASSEEVAQVNQVTNAGLKSGKTLKIPFVGEKVVYTVRSGDSLTKIASRFGMKMSEITQTNNLKSDALRLGQKLGIPVKVQGLPLSIVQAPAAPGQPIAKAPAALEKISPVQPVMVSVAPRLEIAAAPASKPSLKITSQDLPKAVEKTTGNPVEKLADKLVQKPVTAMPTDRKILAVTTTPAVVRPAKAVEVDNQTRLVSHTVKHGESLSVLANRFHTSINDIVTHNPKTNSVLKAGEKIQIPVSKKYYRVLQVKSRREEVTAQLRMPVSGRRTDPFGWRMHPVYRKRLFHAGVDIAAPRGTPIFASQNGTVSYAGWMSGYGKVLMIKHAQGLSTRYGHCSTLRVKQGQVVKKGQIIGAVGATGTATGNHLHFEVRRNGKPVNPMTFLR